MIRDNMLPAARWRVAPEDDELATERVGELAGPYLAGLTFTIFASVDQLARAIQQGAGFNSESPEVMANGGAWSKVSKMRAIGKDGTISVLWLWITTNEVTVLTVVLEKAGSSITDPNWNKNKTELLGE